MGKIELDHTGAGSGVTLSSDGTDLLLNGTAVGGGFGSDLTLDDKTANYTIVAADAGKVITHSANSITISLTAAATLGSGFHVWIKNRGAANSVTTIDPDGTETVDGRGIVYLYTGESTHLYTDGTKWYTVDRTIMFAGNTATDYYAPPTVVGAGSIAAGLQATADGSDAASYGYTASASGTNSLALGYATIAAATRATAIGYSRASGTDSFAAAIASNSSSYGATGASSVAMGYLAKANGSYGFAAGYQNIASGNYSVALGRNSTSAGAQGFSAGYLSEAAAENSIALGFRSKTNVKGQFAVTSGYFGGAGDAQTSIYTFRSDTADATPEALTADNAAASTTNQVILPNNSAFAFHGTIVARQQASAGTACAAWKIEGLIRREGSAGTTVLVNSATTVLDNTPAWGMALTADTTNGGLKIEVTGAAATNIRWVATLNTSEVTY